MSQQNDANHTPPNAGPEAPNTAQKEDAAQTPDKQSVARHYYTKAESYVRETIRKRMVPLVAWLDSHNGAVTAGATVIIALLTYSLAKVSHGQLAQMKADSASSDANTTAQLRVLQSQADAAKLEAQALKDAAEQAKISASTARDTLTASQRAWVGVISAGTNAAPVKGNDFIVDVRFQNSGREPGRNLNSNSLQDAPFPILSTSLNSIVVKQLMQEHQQHCRDLTAAEGNMIAYPTSNLSTISYMTHPIVPGSLMVDSVITGDEDIIVQGCVTYYTQGIVAHSAYCFVWNAKQSDPQFLSFCPAGNDGD